MSNVTSLQSLKPLDKQDMLDVLDTLRADVEAGKIVAFKGVGFDASDCCFKYGGTVGSITKMRMGGALSWLLAEHWSE